jgi:hypothetical protein
MTLADTALERRQTCSGKRLRALACEARARLKHEFASEEEMDFRGSTTLLRLVTAFRAKTLRKNPVSSNAARH